MSGLKILVVEDEIVVADNICEILEALGYEVAEPAINYTQALEAIEEEAPDLLMLDIQLAGSKDGIELAQKVTELYNIPYIFLTSNADPRTVERAKQLSPSAYLVKPFNRDDLYTSIEMAIAKMSKPVAEETSTKNDQNYMVKDAIFVRHKHTFHKVELDEIRFLKADHVYVELFVKDGKKHVIRTSLTEFTAKLPPQFFRLHRSYTINLNHLQTINTLNVEVDHQSIPIGKNYRDALLARVTLE